MPNRITRRTFLRQSGRAAMAGGTLLASTRATRAATLGANERVGLAWIGCGGRGNQLLDAFSRLPDLARVVACCDVHRGRAEAFKNAAGGNINVHADFRELLDRKDIDAVVVPTTGHWHCLPTIHACQAGKDTYVEKPLAWSIGEGRMMVKAARRYDRIVVMGSQQRSTPSFQEAVAFIQSGKLGKISSVRMWNNENVAPGGYGNPPDGPPPPELDWDFWLGPAPKRTYNPNYFDHHYWFWDYGGGWQSEWAVHHHDVTHWAMQVDTPLSASAVGGIFARQDNCELPDTIEVAYEYPGRTPGEKGFMTLYSFRQCNAHFHEETWYGSAFYGENGTLVVNRQFWKVIPEPVQMHHPDLGKQMRMAAETHPGSPGEGHPDHQRNFLHAVKDHKILASADVEVGHRSSIPGHLANISYRLGRTIRWDAEKEEVKDDPDANRMLSREYRKPWTLEV